MYKNRKESEKTELQKIREKLGYSTRMFAEKVLGRSLPAVVCYENGSSEIPDKVLAKAIEWYERVKDLLEENESKKRKKCK